MKDETGSKEITEAEGLELLKTTIKQAREEFSDAEKVLKKFYQNNS